LWRERDVVAGPQPAAKSRPPDPTFELASAWPRAASGFGGAVGNRWFGGGGGDLDTCVWLCEKTQASCGGVRARRGPIRGERGAAILTIGLTEECDGVGEIATDKRLEEDHGEASAQEPELDEALDPDLGESAFEVEVDPALEARDLHEADEELDEAIAAEHRAPRVMPRSERTIPGMGGKVFDYRGTGLCPPNGGRIRPLVMVHHIPVVRNVAGTADFVTLGQILRGQGLAIQAATDAEGNVALYTRLDELCFGHRGANQLACGVEHMHMTVDEPWTEEQMRAAAWCAARVSKSFGIPPREAKLRPGEGLVGVTRRGHTSHKVVSSLAGFNDRSDPGPRFDFAHLYELTRFFEKHGRF
jgi:hypothetical protein